jgi:hypothetical protein
VRRTLRAARRAVPGDSRAGRDKDHIPRVLPDHPSLHTRSHGEQIMHVYQIQNFEELMKNVAKRSASCVALNFSCITLHSTTANRRERYTQMKTRGFFCFKNLVDSVQVYLADFFV